MWEARRQPSATVGRPIAASVLWNARQVRTVFKEYRQPLSMIFEHYAALDNVRPPALTDAAHGC